MPRLSVRAACLLTLGTLAAACGRDPVAPVIPAGAQLSLTLHALRALDPQREGRYEAWIADAAGRLHSAGVITLSAAGGAVPLTNPVDGARAFLVTVEPPGDADPAPSAQRLLAGRFDGARATLSVVGAVTQDGVPLRERPGQFTMFSPSDNAEQGYPSHEEAGIWLFNMAPRETEQNDMWVRLAQLAPGWTYEGWMVRDRGTAQAVWLSYGKFLPDATGAVSVRDDTGWGPFSGVLDYRTAGEEEFPGDDWISNPHGYPVPGDLPLPLDLREQLPDGTSRWTHVISIEPVWDRGEPVASERPFLLQPYRDPFGTGGPGAARPITFHASSVPSGTVEVR